MLDGIRDVGIDGGRVTAVTEDHLEGTSVVDVTGLVVAPGFIDLHSHAQTLAGRRLQAFDGVTTALDLEAGRTPIREAYAHEVSRGSPINYGFSSSWAAVRARVVSGLVPDGGIASGLSVLGDKAWTGPVTREQVSQVLGHLSDDLAQGAIGIGLLLGYAPDVDPEEYLAVARLAAGTGEGGRITTEAYPYGAGATVIGAPFLAPERLRERRLSPPALTYLPTGERVADEARLRQLRAADPNGLVVYEYLNEDDPADMAVLRRSLTFANAIVASDALPLVPVSDDFDPDQWPLTAGAVTHPRSAGCFSRALRLWREEGGPLAEAVRRCTLLPARALEASCPSMRTRGRLQPGSAADVVVFDAGKITDQATYAASTRPSSGVRHLVVSGEFVIRDGNLAVDARPGQPITAQL
jgi:hypothetical protein